MPPVHLLVEGVADISVGRQVADRGQFSGRKWAESGLRCAVAAIHSWGKLKPHHEGGGYTWLQAKAEHPDPVWTDKPWTS